MFKQYMFFKSILQKPKYKFQTVITFGNFILFIQIHVYKIEKYIYNIYILYIYYNIIYYIYVIYIYIYIYIYILYLHIDQSFKSKSC